MNHEHLYNLVESIDLEDDIDALAKAYAASEGEIGERIGRILAYARQLKQDIDDLALDELHQL